MNNQDNPYSGTTGAGNYQMSYQSNPEKPESENKEAGGAGQTQAGGDIGLVKDISTAQFVAEVIEASKSVPVVIDFWAPWCGPCKQLTPVLEKVGQEFAGQVKLVKMNTEQYPEIPGQMGIQSIPAVVAFVEGKPVDAFVGVKPESEIRSFFEKHGGPSKGVDAGKIMADARQLIAQDDLSGAMNMLASFLQTDPENSGALALLGTVYLRNNDTERAENIFRSISEDQHGKPDVAALRAELELAKQADDLGDVEQLIKAVEADPADLQAKFELSLAYNVAGNREEAADMLLEIIKKNRQWNEDGARKQLVKYFEAWGEGNEATQSGRRKLSTVLFS